MPTLTASEKNLVNPGPRVRAVMFAGSALLLCNACIVEMGDRLDPETGFVPESQEQEQVIIGALGWVNVTSLDENSPERANSRAVGYVSIPAKGSRCTGFLISDDVVMTNEHCITNQGQANNVTVAFRREAGVPWSEWAEYECSEFLGDSRQLDFALLRCQGAPGQVHGVVELEATTPPVNHQLYAIHQNCDYYAAPGCSPTKKLSSGQLTGIGTNFVRHTADTLGGSSGAPLFSSTSHKVFGLHNIGAGNNGNGRGSYNQAIKMSRILDRLASAFPQIDLGASSAVPAPITAPDLYEPNDSAGSAAPISAPFAATELRIAASDVDVFRISTAQPGTLSVDLLFAHAAGDLDVTLHAGSLSNPAVAKGDSASDDEELVFENAAAGTYYVVIYGYNGAQNDYDFGVAFAPQTSADMPTDNANDDNDPDNDPDAIVDDGSMQTARTVGVPFNGEYAIEAAGDEDFFAFTLDGAASSEVTVSLQFTHAAGDLDLYLLDASGATIGNSLSTTDVESITQALPAGTYFVRVIGYSDAAGDYRLELR